jgi:hypothetical protein
MKKLKINLNSSTLTKAASLISNSVLLTSNAFLIGSGFSNYFKDRKRERITTNLQVTAEIASAIAGLTKVVTETLEKHHEPAGD